MSGELNYGIELFPSKGTSHYKEFHVLHLISLSDEYLKQAHQNVSNVRIYTNGQEQYFKLIKLSIKTLLFILKKYKNTLSPEVETFVLISLARIYLEETRNFDKAEYYANLALAVALENRMMEHIVLCRLLIVRALKETDNRLALRMLLPTIDTYSHYPDIVTFFSILEFEIDYNGQHLQKYRPHEMSSDIMKAVFYINLATKFLQSSNISCCLDLLSKSETHLKALENPPIQVMAMAHLLKYQCFILCGDNLLIQNYFVHLNEFTKRRDVLAWKTDSHDNRIRIPIEMAYNRHFNLVLSWISGKEFFLLLYNLLSIPSLTNGKSRKSTNILKVSLGLTAMENNSSQDSTTKDFNSLAEIQMKTSNLMKINHNLEYYSLWARLFSGNIITPQELALSLPKDFNLDGFLANFSNRIIYLNGMIQLLKGNRDKAFESFTYLLKTKDVDLELKLYSALQLITVTFSLRITDSISDLTFRKLSNDYFEFITSLEEYLSKHGSFLLQRWETEVTITTIKNLFAASRLVAAPKNTFDIDRLQSLFSICLVYLTVNNKQDLLDSERAIESSILATEVEESNDFLIFLKYNITKIYANRLTQYGKLEKAETARLQQNYLKEILLTREFGKHLSL